MKNLAIAAALLLTAAPAYAEDQPDWSWTLKTPIPFLNQVELTPQRQQVAQQPIPIQYQPQPAPVQYLPAPAPQQVPIPYPTGGGSPGVVVIPITTGTAAASPKTSLADVMLIKLLLENDQRSQPAPRRGLGSYLGDVLTGASEGFARGAAESAGRKLTDRWMQ